MEGKGHKQAVRSRSSSSSSSSNSSSSSDSGSVTPKYASVKNNKSASLNNDRKTSNFVNRDKVRLVGGKLVKEEEMPKYWPKYDLTAVKRRPRMALTNSGAVLHYIV